MTLIRVVQTPIWKWLFDVYRVLGATIEILDDRLTSLASSSTAGGPAADLEVTNEAWRAITPLSEAPGKIVSIGGRRFSCTPIMSAGSLVGAVLVGSIGPHALADTELTRAGALLTRALEDHLVDDPHQEHRIDSRRVTALHQLLHAASAHGSEHEVIRIFAEALSVWEDVEVLGYRCDLSGRYGLETALPGSDRALVPHTIDREPIPAERSVLGLTRADREALGFRGSGETTLARLTTEGGPWLIAMNAAADPQGSEWFDLYVAALAISLDTALAVETSRLTWRIVQHFVEATAPDRGAIQAVRAVAQAIGAEGSFTAWSTDGEVVVSAGGPLDFARDPAMLRSVDLLRSRVDTGAASVATLEMRSNGRRFSQREVKLFDAAVANFGTWFTTVARQFGAARERRQTPRSFDQTVDRYVREAPGARDAALILISPATTGTSPELTYSWINRVRPQLRPTDLAGRLTSGEVAVLALETLPAGARVVAQRIAQILAASRESGEPALQVGFAANAGESLSGHVLIDRARSQVIDVSPPKG